MVGDFGLKENYIIHGGRDSWRHKFLDSIQETGSISMSPVGTLVRGADPPSLQDLIFRYDNMGKEHIRYDKQLDKSDHVVLQFNYRWLVRT